MGKQVLSMTVPCSRAGNDFGQWRMGFGVGRKEPHTAQRSPIRNVDNSFDRHVCFIIGSFLMNGSGELMKPFVSLKMTGLNNLQESLTFQIWFLAISGRSPLQNGNEPVFMRTGNKQLSVIHHFVQCLWSPLKRLGTPSSRLKGKTKAGVRSPVDGF